MGLAQLYLRIETVFGLTGRAHRLLVQGLPTDEGIICFFSLHYLSVSSQGKESKEIMAWGASTSLVVDKDPITSH